MKTPPISQPAPTAAPKGNRGRFVGLVATGKEKYQVVLLETVGDVVTKREVVYAGRTETINGKQVSGETLPSALQGLGVVVMKRIRDASDLWMKPA